MWYILMFMTWHFLFSSQYLSHPVASSDAQNVISHQVMLLLFLKPFPSPQCIRHGSRSSSTRPSSPFWPNSSNSTWIGTGTKSHLPSRWPEWLPWWTSSSTSLTAHRPSPTTSPCSHHSSQVEAYDTDDTISKVLSQPFSTDQQYPDRQPGLQVDPTPIGFLALCCLPKARARRNGNTDAQPQLTKRMSALLRICQQWCTQHDDRMSATSRYQNISYFNLNSCHIRNAMLNQTHSCNIDVATLFGVNLISNKMSCYLKFKFM